MRHPFIVSTGLIWFLTLAPLVVFASHEKRQTYETSVCLRDSPLVDIANHDTIHLYSQNSVREFRLEKRKDHVAIYQKVDGQNLGFAGYLYHNEYDSLKATAGLESYLRGRFMNNIFYEGASDNASIKIKPQRRRRRNSFR